MRHGPPPSLLKEELLAGWRPRRVGRRLILLGETDSTNRVALESAGEADADGLVVLADRQRQGRGRLGRVWESPRGASVLLSVVLRWPMESMAAVGGGAGGPSAAGVQPPMESQLARQAARLTQVAAVAACEAIRQATEITPAIKWPNDLRVNGRKLGGILIESRPVANDIAFVIGIGINCLQQVGHLPPELRDIATSLEMLSSRPVDRAVVARELLRQLDRWLEDGSGDAARRVHQAWLAYAEPMGQQIVLRQDGQDYAGWLIAVDGDGGLLVRLERGQQMWFDPMRTTVL